MIINPIAIEKTSRGEKQYDVFSRLFSDRNIFLVGEIEEELVTYIISQIIYLNSLNDDPITLYINSDGGRVDSGLALIDVMNMVESPIYTIVLGSAYSMGSVIASCGEKGHRFATKNSRFMLHQPSGSVVGHQTDIQILSKEIKFLRKKLEEILSETTGQKISKIRKDLERDFYMSSEEALEYGLIDKII